MGVSEAKFPYLVRRQKSTLNRGAKAVMDNSRRRALQKLPANIRRLSTRMKEHLPISLSLDCLLSGM
ncbi:hypothetical protein K491DRAFT_238240 [Lophiostoma macrostomum CBS 122681]|uniref:Uncharacterized protein n=1 Tax=Lophiostoma macrostomum CBS 122681 TaxID=1314788 RepID=A0A6A6SNX8_9PLEO|nr:hypothetical protein K491DRAFT_238240 [Lophiostoma macrostomum CBS 122681]